MKKGFNLIVFNLLLIILNFLVFVFYVIYPYEFEDQKTISTEEWEYISKLDSYSEFFLPILFASFLIFIFLSFIQILIVIKRLFQNKEKVNPWKYFYKISITILVILSTPVFVIGSLESGFYDQKEKFATNLDLKIREYLVESRSYVFEPDWNKDELLSVPNRKKFELVDPFNLDKDTHKLESYIKKFPPEKNYFERRDTPNYRPWYGNKVVSTKSLYANNGENYFCILKGISSNVSKWDKYKGDLYAVYTSENTSDAKILIPNKDKLLFEREFDGIPSNSSKKITFENEILNIYQSREVVTLTVNNDISSSFKKRSVDMVCEKILSETMLEDKVKLYIPIE